MANEDHLSTVSRTLISPLKVGRHKHTGRDEPIQQDGFISAILILVFLVGLSLTIVISQFLSNERVVTKHQVQPFVTQIVLITLLVPGVVTIAYAFKYRGHIKTVVHSDQSKMTFPETVNMAGVYIFASCAIAFDLFSVICECNCLEGNIADSVVDIIFYICKAIFTLLQCLFVRKFQKSSFDSKPFLQVSLVSIIAANMAIWIYTTIDEHSGDFFGKAYDEQKVDPWIASSQPVCYDKKLEDLHGRLQLYFSPFTLEFSLLVFEKILQIWGQMKHLDHVENIPLDSLLDNIELSRIKYEIEGKNNVHKRMRTKLTTSQRRIWLWIEQLYNDLADQFNGESRNILDQCYSYSKSLQLTLENLDSTIKDESSALQDAEELEKLNSCVTRIQPFQGQRANNEALQNIAGTHRTEIEVKRQTLRANLKSTVAAINNNEANLNRYKDELHEAQLNLPQVRPGGRNCGLGCSGGLLLGIFIFSIGMVLVASHNEDVSVMEITGNNCHTNDSSKSYGFAITELLHYSLLINIALVFVNIIHVFLTLHGFRVLLEFKSNYQRFRFTDIFYCISCIGSVILLSFSIISSIAVIHPNAEVYTWTLDRGLSNQTLRALRLDTTCANSIVTSTSWANLIYISTHMVEIFLCSAFIIQAGQMLPHGDVCRNKRVSEVIQFLGIIHFFLWVVSSFIYSPNLSQFYFVEEFYYGTPTFAVLARLTYPFIIFYHFTTAMRCISLFYQYEAAP